MQTLTFPPHFIWGTSSAAAQIETASDHNWRGVQARDGYIFDRTTDHELRRGEDVELISQFGSLYRCGVDWARLQPAPFAPFEASVVAEYQTFFASLAAKDMRIMFVIHHFTHPRWFAELGGFAHTKNEAAFLDYATQCIEHFGEYAYAFNTFNEPNVYAANGYSSGNFPPFLRNPLLADRVLRNMGALHSKVYKLLKVAFAEKQVGISLNTAVFRAEHWLATPVAKFADWWFNHRAATLFPEGDFWGLSYYALVPFTPMPITEIDRPGELAKQGRPHDDMWAYYPEGLRMMVKRFYTRFGKPIWITENGVCTNDPQQRVAAINDYLVQLHLAITQDNVPVIGYTHWSTWDNFEWNIGPTFRFGLMTVDLDTKDRSMTEAAHHYIAITTSNSVVI